MWTKPRADPEASGAFASGPEDGGRERPAAAGGGRGVFTVSDLTRLIRETLENAFGAVWVEGEVSNLRRPASGHLYFTLKDAASQIAAVLFRGEQRHLRFEPRDGLLVRVYGELTVYERGGNYQILVRRMEEWGRGALHARFEALKEKLRAEGLFDPSRKKPIPMLPRHIGVVTSPTGAAIRDILKVISRRFPNLHVLVAPVKVQGEGAAGEIASAIDLLNDRGGLDVLIVGRGGGSLEDLWCFNEEIVARAIARSRVPVISAVGHEIDFTISDFVADLRAPTPSAAAELVVDRKAAFEESLSNTSRQLGRALRECLLRARHRLLTAERSYVFREPRNLVRQYAQQVDALGARLAHAAREGLRGAAERAREIGVTMAHAVRERLRAGLQDARRLEAQLKALSPLAVLARGYSVTSDELGRVIRSAEGLATGQRLLTRLARGAVESSVVNVRGEPAAGGDGKEE